MQQNCDGAPLKELIKEQLRSINDDLLRTLDAIDNESHCLLSDFDNIRESFRRMEAMSASFYLECYLSSFTNSYSDLSLVIRRLSERRHGALIVVKRKEPLENHIHSGIQMKATLTSSLLESIFYPGNSLHDGAVLIITDQIISAANVLPVSNATINGKKLGTRHRAALGLSELTDALVLVVSEETGSASFAFKGILHPLHIVNPEHWRA